MITNREEIQRSSVETEKELRIGIIGADAKAGWAKISHVPAVIGLPGVKLAAVTTRTEQRAREAAHAFGADRWFSDPFAMIRDDQVHPAFSGDLGLLDGGDAAIHRDHEPRSAIADLGQGRAPARGCLGVELLVLLPLGLDLELVLEFRMVGCVFSHVSGV